MKLAVPKQSQPTETRVALTPAVVEKLVAANTEIYLEPGAGANAHHSDEDYRQAGAIVVGKNDAASFLADADIVVTIGPPTDEQTRQLAKGCILIGMLAPLKYQSTVDLLVERRITAFSMEFIPRISRAQSMDVLSSQANIAGYKAVLLAADAGAKIYPMMMTAAGTISPSRVFIIGAGVAGLQAIATARRLGAVVEAFDVRPVVKEQVQSLGARFVELPLDTQDSQAAGGYAKQQTDEDRQKQTELMAKHVIGADAVISTAALFAKAPPLLIPNDVVGQMHAGSVIVDYAADTDWGRGNCEATIPGQHITTDNGVRIIGETNMPALVPVHASQAYASNMQAFLKEIIIDGKVTLDLEDEIQQGAAITHEGNVIHEIVQKAREQP